MHRRGREGRQADRDVFGALRLRRAVANPLGGIRDDRLTCPHLEDAAGMFDAKQTAKNDRDLSELRTLSGLAPASRRNHASDAQLLLAGARMPHVLLDSLRLATGGGDEGRTFD